MRFCICIDAADGKQAYSVRTCTKLKFVRDIFCLFLPFSSLHSLSCSLFSSFSTLLLNLFIWVFFNCAHHSLAHSSTSFSLSIEFFLLIFVHTAQMCEFRSSIGWTVKYSISIWLSNERSKSLPCTNTRTLLLFFFAAFIFVPHFTVFALHSHRIRLAALPLFSAVLFATLLPLYFSYCK